jgi:hypothetical protein
MTTGHVVLMVKILDEDIHCPECKSGRLTNQRGLSPAEARREIDRVYRGWHCECRKFPQSRVEVHVQGPRLEYLRVCTGCAAELTGVPKDELIPPALRQSAGRSQ